MGFLSKIFKPKSAKVVDYTGPDYRDPGMWNLVMGKHLRRWMNSSSIFYTPSYEQMENAYNHPIVGSCVDVIASAFTDARCDLGTEDGNGDWKSVSSHRLIDLLKRPNPYMSTPEFFEQVMKNFETTGFGYIWKIREGSRIVNLLPLPTSWVTPHLAKYGGFVDYFDVRGNGKVLPQDMIVLMKRSPNDLTEASPPLLKCWRDVMLDRKRESFQVEFLENMKVPGLIAIKKSGFGSERRRKAAERELDETLGEMTGRQGNSLLLEGDIDVKVNQPISDLDWPGLTSITESRICASFGVPGIIIGCRFGMDRSTYSNFEQAEKALYTRTMPPKWKSFASALTRGLIMDEPEPNKTLKFKFAFEELPQFQEDESELATRAIMEYSAGLLSEKEARELLGYTGVNPDNDVYREMALRLAQGPAEKDEEETEENSPPPPPNKSERGAKSIALTKAGIELAVALKRLQQLNRGE